MIRKVSNSFKQLQKVCIMSFKKFYCNFPVYDISSFNVVSTGMRGKNTKTSLHYF